MYFLDKTRYGKYFGPKMDMGGSQIYESDFKTKWYLQQMNQAEMIAQGITLNAIFQKKEASADSNAVTYLLWLDWQWSLYQKTLKDNTFMDEGFVRFVQSDLSNDVELTESWKIK